MVVDININRFKATTTTTTTALLPAIDETKLDAAAAHNTSSKHTQTHKALVFYFVLFCDFFVICLLLSLLCLLLLDPKLTICICCWRVHVSCTPKKCSMWISYKFINSRVDVHPSRCGQLKHINTLRWLSMFGCARARTHRDTHICTWVRTRARTHICPSRSDSIDCFDMSLYWMLVINFANITFVNWSIADCMHIQLASQPASYQAVTLDVPTLLECAWWWWWWWCAFI